MSAWLARALASAPCGPPVPNVSESPKRDVPKLPKSDRPHIGDYGTIGTGGAIDSGEVHQAPFEVVDHVAVEPVITEEEWLARFEERAAVREFEGGFDRSEAERLARQDLVEEAQTEGNDGACKLFSASPLWVSYSGRECLITGPEEARAMGQISRQHAEPMQVAG